LPEDVIAAVVGGNALAVYSGLAPASAPSIMRD